jgi:hypothetical protein
MHQIMISEKAVDVSKTKPEEFHELMKENKFQHAVWRQFGF